MARPTNFAPPEEPLLDPPPDPSFKPFAEVEARIQAEARRIVKAYPAELARARAFGSKERLEAIKTDYYEALVTLGELNRSPTGGWGRAR